MEELLNYEGLIYSIINKYTKNFDKDDLFQVGMLGLIEAYKNYKNNFNTKFSTYAYYYILGEVNSYIRESSSLKVSKDLLKLSKSIIKAREVMQQSLQREPTNLEIALFLEIDEEKVNEAIDATEVVKSLDYQDENIELYNSIKVEDNSLNPDILDLKEALKDLSTEERNIILARYFEELTQVETSKELGISQVQVSRKEAKVLQKLKEKLQNT